jgi:hypothetical protein
VSRLAEGTRDGEADAVRAARARDDREHCLAREPQTFFVHP